MAGGCTDEAKDLMEIAGAVDEEGGDGDGPGWERGLGDLDDLLGSMQLEPHGATPGVVRVGGNASGGEVDVGRAEGTSLEIGVVDSHTHPLGATDAVTAGRDGPITKPAGDGGVNETLITAEGASGRTAEAHSSVVSDGCSSSSFSLGEPLPEVHHGGTAETLLVPCSVRNFLDEYFEANQSSKSIYHQAVVASRAIRSVGEETGAEPLHGPEARPSTKSARAQRRADAAGRASSPSPSNASLRRRQRSAARVVKQKERASTRRLVELFKEQCGVVVGRFARYTRVYDGTRASARAVMGGKAIVVQDLKHSCVVWAAVVMDEARFYCSCHGRREAESVAMQMKRGLSSSCKHAIALNEAHKYLAAAFGYAGLTQLHARHPQLANQLTNGGMEPTSSHVAHLPNEGELHVVNADDLWATVEKPPATARNQRVFCQAPLCRTSNRTCIHARAVSPPGPAEDDDDRDDGADDRADEVAKDLAARHAASPFRDVDWPRRSRNLLPCTAEVELCSAIGHSAKTGSIGGVIATYPDVLSESVCLVHGTAQPSPPNLKIKNAIIISLDGFVNARTGTWQCPDCPADNNLVRFDGTSHALFATSSETLFTRTFLDVIINITLTTKSSLAASSAVMAFQMHANSALHGRDVGVLRQVITTATELYAKTLIVPPQVYHCTNCRRSRRRPYTHIICDGQTLAPFKNKTHPFVRDTANCPTVPVPIAEGCVARVAGVRRVVRKRVKLKWNEACAVAKADGPKMAKFAKCGTETPGIDLGRVNRAKTAEWAGSYLFFSFYNEGTGSLKAEQTDGDGSGSGGASSAATDKGINDEASSVQSTSGSSSAGTSAPFKSIVSSAPAIGAGQSLSAAVVSQRWSNVRTFFRAFVAEPVIGIFGGCIEKQLRRLGRALVRGEKQSVWLKLMDCVHGVNVLVPFLLQVADDMDADPLLCQAIGELVLFSMETDRHVERLWALKATEDSKIYQSMWQDTSAGKFTTWRRKNGTADPRSGLRAHELSTERALQQAREVASGQVWPLLDQVRPGPRDDRAAALRKKRKAAGSGKRRAGRSKEAKESKAIGDDDCRHEFKASKVFAPGVVSFLCSCGILLGFEMLEDVESPACIVSALAARFPRLPYVIYFDTACQAARNATRRMPWLVRLSATTWALDRFHAPGHVCSPMFDANMYPGRSSGHKTSAAENRHSLNKPLKTHLTYLGQDRFIVQMRLHGAFNNLRVKYRKHLGVGKARLPEVTHRPLTAFFHAYVVNHCEVPGCDCRPAEEIQPPPTPPSSRASSSSSRSSSPGRPSSLSSSTSPSVRSMSAGSVASSTSNGSGESEDCRSASS